MNYMDRFATPEEFLQRELNRNKGTQNCINKSELVKIAAESDINCTGKESKAELVSLLINKLGGEEIEKRCNVGVGSHCFQLKYSITKEDIKRLANEGILRITGTAKFRAHGKECKAPLYSVYDYFAFAEKKERFHK